MEKKLPNPGTHPANAVGQLVVYEAGTGSLCVAIPVRIQTPETTWTGKHTVTIVTKDGTVRQRDIATLKKVFGWDGLDPFWLMFEDPEKQDTARDLSACPFEIVGEHQPYTPEPTEENPDPQETMTFKIQWLNEVGGGGAPMPEAGDRKKILAKYGSKFKAISGGVKAKPAAATPAAEKPAAAAPAKPAAKPAAPSPRKKDDVLATTATADEAYGVLVEKNGELTEDQQASAWYAKIEELFPGKQSDELSLKQYGQLKDWFSANPIVVE